MYRTPTHTDLYLNFSSNHHLEHERSVVRTLHNRANQLVTNNDDKTIEVIYVNALLRNNNYEMVKTGKRYV